MKRVISTLLAMALACALLGIFPGCARDANKKYREQEARALEPIQYTQSLAEQKTDDSIIILVLPPDTSLETGEEITVKTQMDASYVLPHKEYSVSAYFYYMVDWGDGTWSYNGPAMQDDAGYRSTVEHTHVYKTAGTYTIRTAAYNLATNTVIGWSGGQNVTVQGNACDHEGMITKATPFSSGAADKAHGEEAILDGDPETYFMSEYGQSDSLYEEKYVGLMFDKNYTLDKVEVQIPQDADVIASNIAIEYTTNFGKTWQALPRYYYLYDYAQGYNIIMNMPNPKGATFVFEFDTICANGIRFSAKMWPIYPENYGARNAEEIEKKLYVSEIRAYGSERMLFYSSMDDSFNADVNNFWTIYGTAQTEPLVFGSEYGEIPNATPFRAGMAMIATTEWMEWNAQKWAWVDNDKINNAMLETLKEIRYGDDGWSGVEGFIWSTTDQQKHFNEQNHYDDNQIFIMACKQYLFSGNFNNLRDINNEPINFFELTNRQGQTMWDRLTKAMDYNLEALEGKTGLLTILDPENQGTPQSNASTYWDAFLCDGYLSAYCNILFYQSLLDMADIYDFRAEQMGIPDTEGKAIYYRELAALVKEKFNKTFWDPVKGRYIGSIDVNGNKHDFGFTYVNFYACRYGIADEDKAATLFEWINGERIVEGDTSTGEDIYAYKAAARVNTVDIASVGPPYYWWDHNGLISCRPGEWGGWGQQQNGGYIFYTAHYDLMARINYLGADNAFERFKAIIEEFRIDELRRYPFYEGKDGFSEGIIGEYPESGLVPLTFLTGFMGVTLTKDGLNIAANLPTEMEYAGCREYNFGGRKYSIRVDKSVTAPVVEKYDDVYFVTVPAGGDYTITPDNRLIKNS